MWTVKWRFYFIDIFPVDLRVESDGVGDIRDQVGRRLVRRGEPRHGSSTVSLHRALRLHILVHRRT